MRKIIPSLPTLAALGALSGAAWAASPKQPTTALDLKEFLGPGLYVSSSNVPLEAALPELANHASWEAFLARGNTVAGVFVLRRREPALPRPYRTVGYPVTPLVFLALAVWSVVKTIAERPGAAIGTVVTMALGIAVHAWMGRRAASRNLAA